MASAPPLAPAPPVAPKLVELHALTTIEFANRKPISKGTVWSTTQAEADDLIGIGAAELAPKLGA